MSPRGRLEVVDVAVALEEEVLVDVALLVPVLELLSLDVEELVLVDDDVAVDVEELVEELLLVPVLEDVLVDDPVVVLAPVLEAVLELAGKCNQAMQEEDWELM